MTVPKVLVSNRGEIAIRVLRAVRELGWRSVAVYTKNDTSHATYADESVELDDVARYMDPKHLAQIARNSNCTHIHPGYGFLGESAQFAQLLSCSSTREGDPQAPQHPAITFVGPTVDVLRISSDKFLACDFARSLNVPVAPGNLVTTSDDIRLFAKSNVVGYPVIIKALDGGGGRGIRIVHSDDEVEEALKRCLGESPSKRLFVEKAFSGARWKHIEVQIVGDGTGEVVHLWERECSVQRRFQKIVEIAPSTLDPQVVQPLLDASIKLARELKYRGLGTFEYLVNAHSREWVFLEINPRLQVEHTVTEEVTGVDLVRAQLLLSQPKATLREVLPSLFPTPPRPTTFAIQLRLTAEDPVKSFQLSTGELVSTDILWPIGPGVRIDTWLSYAPEREDGSSSSPPHTFEVGTDFDSLLAKVIISGDTFDHATRRAIRALQELKFSRNIKTNVELLAGIVSHEDWRKGNIDTLWLERHVEEALRLGKSALEVPSARIPSLGSSSVSPRPSQTLSSSGTVLIQPGTSFNLTLSPIPQPGEPHPITPITHKHTLSISSVTYNAFPDELAGSLQTSFSPTPLDFSLTRMTTSLLSSTSFESPDPRNPGHISSPLTGKIVELHPSLLFVAEGQKAFIKKGQIAAVISVMKMESVVESPVSGFVERVGRGVEVGVVISEGMLLCVVEPELEGVFGGMKSHL